MTRKNKKYSCKLDKAFYRSLVSRFEAGVSKHKLKKTDPERERKIIHTSGTLETYAQRLGVFAAWLNVTHPEVRTVKKARKYANEWLEYRKTEAKNQQGKSLSARTVSTDAAAINKVYGVRPDDPDRFQPPRRRREDITRSRGPAVRDSHFSEKNNWELVCFCRGTGPRPAALKRLEGRDLWTREQMAAAAKNLRQKAPGELSKDQARELQALNDALDFYKKYPQYDTYVCYRKDKGGRTRFSPIIGDHKEEIVQRFRDTPADEKVWKAVPSAADIYSYRGDYAVALYREHARPLEQCGKREIYYCRGDMRGCHYDKVAMRVASKALGHNRLSVIAGHYLRGI